MTYSPTAPAVVEVATVAAVDEPASVVDAVGSVAVEVDVEGIPEVSVRRCTIRCSTSRSIQLTHAWCMGKSAPEEEVASAEDNGGGEAMINSVSFQN